MLKRNFTAHIELLSNVHIGTGTNLVADLDWLAHTDGNVYFADNHVIMNTVLDRALANGQDELAVVNAITGMTLRDLVDAGWLTQTDFRSTGKLFRYQLRGKPATRDIHEQIKDIEGRPYLPGSSVKGALRTILAVAAANEKQPSLEQLKHSRTWAAQPVEQELFGSDPNHDLFRILQVSDSQPVDATTALRLRRVHIYPTASQSERGNSRGLDLDMEMLVQGTKFTIPIHMPLELITQRDNAFDARRRAELESWRSHRQLLQRLAAYGRIHAGQLLIEETTYFQQRQDVPVVRLFYNQLADRFTQLEKNQFLVTLGWGTGWHTKTLGDYLKRDPAQFDQLVERYKLDPTGHHNPGDRFPKSRHLLRSDSGEPGNPLGWALVTLETD